MTILRGHVSDIADASDEEGYDIFKENFAKSPKLEKVLLSDCKFRASKIWRLSRRGGACFLSWDANKLRAKAFGGLKNP